MPAWLSKKPILKLSVELHEPYKELGVLKNTELELRC